jgi:arylformamidase
VTPLEIEYSPSSKVASLDHELQVYAAAGARVRAGAHRVLQYGAHHDEFAVVVDAPPASRQGPPLHVFVHGGYWQALTAWDGLGMAEALSAAGVTVASVNYTIAPHATIEQMIDQCCRALDAVVADLAPSSVTLSGSSAGAHLAAHVALRRTSVHTLLLLSGVYDLTPLLQTYVNDELGMTDHTAAAWSVPFDRVPQARVLVVHGDADTDAFRAQSARLAGSWGVPLVDVVGRHHFDLVDEVAALHSAQLDDRRSWLHAATPTPAPAVDHRGAAAEAAEAAGAARRVHVAAGSLERVAAT